jgi:hypothetical protein
MAITEDLEVLEKALRQLQIEWEKFFAGTERKPPMDLKSRVEGLIRRYAYAEIRNNTDRFRYQSLTSRYNAFSELWTKRLRAMEEGRSLGRGPRAPAMPSGMAAAASPAASPAAPSAAPAGEFRIRAPEQEKEAVRDLFERYVAARRDAGESGAVKYESFEKIIAQQASRILVEKGGQAVDFRLETKDGKVSLKARPVKS